MQIDCAFQKMSCYVRAELVVKDPRILSIRLGQGFQSIEQWKGPMPDLLHHSLENDYWGYQELGFHQVHLIHAWFRLVGSEDICMQYTILGGETHWCPAE